mmetsp:Transcript_22109/g.36556  ORF Transcript_22109/g.36556 Transcript_22109/m.36556 type:complete len:151 (+) Transcript_22109:474-926(+)|eukprot:CAMPEP_0119341248 /NCGR_PEP_ID=MMETSP1333-20130426/101947_1 /TAXON_ID=418940 /ORGANISM="Scyphosphaera apsteinii, Strain RCC1455" /LENGTH=150 /DNA_ID=CAMNT_0007353171 /DNA_START=465 /DNA_END=917 /DNA_ORIENTATION=+
MQVGLSATRVADGIARGCSGVAAWVHTSRIEPHVCASWPKPDLQQEQACSQQNDVLGFMSIPPRRFARGQQEVLRGKTATAGLICILLSDLRKAVDAVLGQLEVVKSCCGVDGWPTLTPSLLPLLHMEECSLLTSAMLGAHNLLVLIVLL